MSDIFISYARPDEARAEQVATALQEQGYQVWRDAELPAHRSYAEVIEERLKSAKAVVVLWSAEAAQIAMGAGGSRCGPRWTGTLVQVVLDGTIPPLPFNQIQCADLSGWTGDSTGATGWK